MSAKEKIKKKDDYILLKCPFSLIKDNCIADECVAWEFTSDAKTYGYCVLIQSK